VQQIQKKTTTPLIWTLGRYLTKVYLENKKIVTVVPNYQPAEN